MKRCGGAVWSLLVHSLSLTHSLSVGWLVGWLLVVFTAKFVRWFVRWFVRCRSLSFVRFDSMVRSFVRLSVGKSLVDRWFVRCRSLIAVLLLRSFVCLFVCSFACSLSLVRCSNYVRWTENFLRCLGVGVVVVAAATTVVQRRLSLVNRRSVFASQVVIARLVVGGGLWGSSSSSSSSLLLSNNNGSRVWVVTEGIAFAVSCATPFSLQLFCSPGFPVPLSAVGVPSRSACILSRGFWVAPPAPKRLTVGSAAPAAAPHLR